MAAVQQDRPILSPTSTRLPAFPLGERPDRDGERVSEVEWARRQAG